VASLFLLAVSFLLVGQTKNVISGKSTPSRIKSLKVSNMMVSTEEVQGKGYAQTAMLNFHEHENIFLDFKQSPSFVDKVFDDVSSTKRGHTENDLMESPNSFYEKMRSFRGNHQRRNPTMIQRMSKTVSNVSTFMFSSRLSQEEMITKDMKINIEFLQETPPQRDLL